MWQLFLVWAVLFEQSCSLSDLVISEFDSSSWAFRDGKSPLSFIGIEDTTCPFNQGKGCMRVSSLVAANETSEGWVKVEHVTERGNYDCRGASNLVLSMYVGEMPNVPGATLQLALMEGGHCNSSSSCDTEDFVVSLDTLYTPTPQGPSIVNLEFDAFKLLDTEHASGDGLFDIGSILGFSFEVLVASGMNVVVNSSFVLDSLKCVGPRGAEVTIISDGLLPEIRNPRALSNINDESFMNSRMGVAAISNVLRINYTVFQDVDWGGYANLRYKLPRLAAFNFSEYSSIQFEYNNINKSSIPGKAHFRLVLLESSSFVSPPESCPDRDPLCVSSEDEFYYSFANILDDEPGWKTFNIPFVASNTFDTPLVLTGWSGKLGNQRLDLDKISGFILEVNIGSVDEGESSSGVIELRNIGLQNETSEGDMDSCLVLSSNSFLSSAAKPLKRLYYAQNRCCEECTKLEGCLFFETSSFACSLFGSLEPDMIKLSTRKMGTEIFLLRSESRSGRACGEHGLCECTQGHADCSARNLTSVPIMADPIIQSIQSIDLSGNPELVIFDAGALSELTSVESVTVVNSNTKFIRTKDLPDSLRVLDFDSESCLNLKPSGKTFQDICCDPKMLNVSTTDGHPVYECVYTDSTLVCPYCVFQPNVSYIAEFSDNQDIQTSMLAFIDGSHRFASASYTLENCVAFCSFSKECSHFTWDNRELNAAPVCFLFRYPELAHERSAPGQEPGSPGYISGYLPEARARLFNATVRSSAPRNHKILIPSNAKMHFEIVLNAPPMHGAVIVTPTLSSSSKFSSVNLDISPNEVVFYRESWNISQKVVVTFTTPLSDLRDPESLILSQSIQSCDRAFTVEQLYPTQITIEFEKETSWYATLIVVLVAVVANFVGLNMFSRFVNKRTIRTDSSMTVAQQSRRNMLYQCRVLLFTSFLEMCDTASDIISYSFMLMQGTTSSSIVVVYSIVVAGTLVFSTDLLRNRLRLYRDYQEISRGEMRSVSRRGSTISPGSEVLSNITVQPIILEKSQTKDSMRILEKAAVIVLLEDIPSVIVNTLLVWDTFSAQKTTNRVGLPEFLVPLLCLFWSFAAIGYKTSFVSKYYFLKLRLQKIDLELTMASTKPT
mmetsp:Transcript_1372/g.1800  ORF Transcript_1372/g.1800 Transcript_1372/m.1800 type:complete len:1120 (-) Transcript_1372:1320-4679(-)